MSFVNRAADAGVDYSIMGEGVCMFDYNRDGLEDIFVCDRFDGEHLLFKNLGNLTFEEVSDEAGINNSSQGRLAISGDYNRDGYPDLFIGAFSNNSYLYMNSGDGTFQDVTSQAGINVPGDVEGGAWCDVNRDGWLDLYVGRLRFSNRLYVNNGDGTFVEMASQMNATGPTSGGLVMGLTFIDYDEDGDDDLFITQDGYRGNIFLRNDGGLFTDISVLSGTASQVMGMGVAVGDYDRNGTLDMYATNLNANSLYQNQGSQFQEIAASAGVEDEAQSMGWGIFFFDSDNDGWLDLYNNNQSGFGQVPNSFYHNQGDGTFINLADSLGIASWNNGIGSAVGDLDNDGDLDMVLVGHSSTEGSIILYENTTVNDNNWIQFRLESSQSNSQGIGSLVKCYMDSILQKRYITAGDGYCSQNSLIQHFGLGSVESIDSIVVHWPNGDRENYGELTSNLRYTLVQGSGTAVITVHPEESILPNQLTIKPNYPNPFNGQTRFIMVNPTAQNITVSLVDLKGRQSVLIDSKFFIQGEHRVNLDLNSHASGIYILNVVGVSYSSSRAITLMK